MRFICSQQDIQYKRRTHQGNSIKQQQASSFPCFFSKESGKYIKSYIDKQPLQSLSKMKAVVLFELIDTCRQKRVLILCVQHNGRISRNSTTVLSRYKSPEGKTITMFALMSIITTYGLKLNAHIRLNSSENNDLFFQRF